jgi:hypothetical protein
MEVAFVFSTLKVIDPAPLEKAWLVQTGVPCALAEEYTPPTNAKRINLKSCKRLNFINLLVLFLDPPGSWR